jgi:hypothetical protein
MSRFPSWFPASFGLLLAMWIGVSIFYHAGADGVRFGRTSAVDFDREHDFALYKIDDEHAFLLMPDMGHVALVNYGKGVAPFCWLCGSYEPQGNVIDSFAFIRGDWAYGESNYESSRPHAINLKTGETITLKLRSADSNPTDSEQFRKLGLVASDEYRVSLNPALALAEREPLSTLNESCMIFNMAFLFLIALGLLLGAIFWIRSRSTASIVQAS